MEESNYSLPKIYRYLFIELADKRTNDWFLMRSPISLLIILGFYVYFVLSLGTNYMKNRQPFQLRKTLIIYNSFQVLLSTFFLIEAIDAAVLHYSWICQPMDHSRSPHAMRIAADFYIYFLSKLLDLLDTVFFVLRKNERQITFLHIYHHVFMVCLTWTTAKYVPSGHGIFPGVINSFVHIFMYMYYLITAFGPEYQKYLWWKKYLTNLQLVQFCLIFINQSTPLFYNCGYPKWPSLMFLPNVVLFFYLFKDFYKSSYTKKQSREKED